MIKCNELKELLVRALIQVECLASHDVQIEGAEEPSELLADLMERLNVDCMEEAYAALRTDA
jgi:hypothetical protein